MKLSTLKPNSIVLYIILPLLPAAVAILLAIMALIAPSLERSFLERMEVSLGLATRLGLEYSDELFQDLLSLRLSEDPRMVETSRQEALQEIRMLSSRFSYIETAAIGEDGTVYASSLEGLEQDALPLSLDPGREGFIESSIEGRPIILHSRYFPFWRWHVVAFTFRSDVLAPVAVIHRGIYLGLGAVMALFLGALILTVQFFVKRPLASIISAAERISRGELPLIDHRRRDEIGRVIEAFNAMVLSLRRHQREADEAMARLRESEQRFRRIIEHSRAGYFFTDAAGYLRHVNSAWLELYGYRSREEVEGRHLRELQAYEEDGSVERQIEALRRGESIPTGEAVRHLRDGSRGYHIFSATPVYREGQLEGFEGFLIDTTERHRSQQALEQSLREKKALLQEIHHRVKNNLNVVVSLLNLQAEYINNADEAKRALLNSRNRIFSMALVHENLYQSASLASIDLKAYLASMISQLFSIYAPEKKIELNLQVEEYRLDITRAVPCALILNELITNSLLHAYPERSSGCITISFRLLESGENELVYHDDGIGLDGREELGSSPGARSRNPGSLGMQLIHVLSQQLEGSEELRSEGGLHFRLTFPETTPAPSSAEAAD